MSEKRNYFERLYPKINKDRNKVYLPNGVWSDWSRYGKNAEDAIDYYNDARYTENVGIMIGTVLGMIITGGAAAVIHFISKRR